MKCKLWQAALNLHVTRSELAALGVPDYEFLKGKTVHGIVAGRSVRWLVPSKVKYIKETCASCGCGVWLSSGCFLEGTLPAACGKIVIVVTDALRLSVHAPQTWGSGRNLTGLFNRICHMQPT